VLISDSLFFVVEEGGSAEIHEGLLEVHFVQLILLSEVVVELLDFIRGVVFSFKFFFRESWIYLHNLGLIIEWDSVSTPVNCTLFQLGERQSFEIIVVLDKILSHLVDFFGVPRDLFMINAAPH